MHVYNTLNFAIYFLTVFREIIKQQQQPKNLLLESAFVACSCLIFRCAVSLMTIDFFPPSVFNSTTKLFADLFVPAIVPPYVHALLYEKFHKGIF